MARTKDKTSLSYAERLDIPQVTLAEAEEQVAVSLDCNQHRGIYVLVGESGVGKTQIFSQMCRARGYGLTVINTAQFSLMGAGIPRKAEGEFFDIAVPSIMPRPGKKSILLFDELNRGLQHAISQFFNLLEDRRLFNYTLPDDCMVVGSMNPDTAMYSVTSIENEPAIRRRVKFLYVIPEFTGWYNHAKTERFHANTIGPAKDKPCHPQVLEYFKANPKMIYDEKARDQGKQYICPAAIQTISEDAYNMEDRKLSTCGPHARIRYGASIGVTGTVQLLEFIKDSTVMLGATDVLHGYTKKAQKAVKKLAEGSQHEKLADLCENVLALLFAEKPDVKEAAANFLNFYVDLPKELSASMAFQMKGISVQSNADMYLIDLMSELQEYDAWVTAVLEMDANQREQDKAIRSGDNTSI